MKLLEKYENTFRGCGKSKSMHINDLIYDDDLILMVNTKKELKFKAETSTEALTRHGLKISTKTLK